MFSSFEWMLALRYLRSRRQEGFISVIAWFSLLGISLGVATLIIVMSVMNGFRQELLNRILGINGHLSIASYEHTLNDYDTLASQIKSLPDVIGVYPLIEGQVMASANGLAQGAVVRGLRQLDLESRDIIIDNIILGDITKFSETKSIVIGHRLASKLGVRIGDQVNLISPKGTITAFGSIPRMGSYNVVALFDIGMYEYDSAFIFMPLKSAQVYFQLKQGVSNLEIFIKDPSQAPIMQKKIHNLMRAGIRIHDWQRANASFFTAIQVERNVMFLILTLIVVVAAFNVISSLIMLVKDKGRDIAILRTMGATRASIMRIFFISGTSIGVLGTSTGLAMGLSFTMNIEDIRQWLQGITGAELFAAEIYFLSQLPAVINPTEVLAVVLMGLGLSVLATIYPSWRAARTDPAESMRYE